MNNSRCVSEVASGSEEVAVNISEVTNAATETNNAGQRVLQASRDLGDQGASLKREIDHFLTGIKSA